VYIRAGRAAQEVEHLPNIRVQVCMDNISSILLSVYIPRSIIVLNVVVCGYSPNTGIPALRRLRQEEQLSLGVWGQTGQHTKTPSLLKKNKSGPSKSYDKYV
jgi:hypothetical protein